MGVVTVHPLFPYRRKCLLKNAPYSLKSDLTIDNFALVTGTLELLFLRPNIDVCVKWELGGAFCADLRLHRKSLFTVTVICRSELMFIYSRSRQPGGEKMHSCTFLRALKAV